MNIRRSRRYRHKQEGRRGAAAVEFALVAPVLVVVLGGYAVVHNLLEVTTEFRKAAYEGARLATMDNRGNWDGDETTNERVVQDIRSFLNASGLPGDAVEVTIADADDADVSFDLEDPANAGKLFQIIIEIEYSDVSSIDVPALDEVEIGSEVVFRNIYDVGN